MKENTDKEWNKFKFKRSSVIEIIFARRGYQKWMVPLNLAGVLMDPVEQGRLEVLGVVVSESSGGSPLASY
jgi:hypothetical protein